MALREDRYSRLDLLKAAAVLAALYLTAGLLWYLPSPGYTTTRLGLFLLIAGLGWLGAAGAVVERPGLAVAGGVGLFLLGFWQAVLWIVMLPAAAGLLGVGVAYPQAERIDLIEA